MSIRSRLLFALVLIFSPAIYGIDQIPFALSLYQQGKFAEAATVLEAADAEKRTSAYDLAVLGLCYLRLQKLDRAEQVLATAFRRNPSLSIVQLALGNLRFAQGRFDQAYIHFNRAAALEPQSHEAKKGMVAALVNRAIQHYAERSWAAARDVLEQALDIEPAYVPALRTLGALELETGNPSGALGLLKQAQNLEPEDPITQALIVRALEDSGDSKALLPALQKLARLQPFDPQPWHKLGQLYEAQGDQQQAQKAFTEAVARGSEEPYPYYHQARRQKDADLAYLAIGKAIVQANLLRLQAARSIKEKEGNLDEEDIELLQDVSQRINEPLSLLDKSLALLRSLRSEDDYLQDLLLLSDWYPHSMELKSTLADLYAEKQQWAEALAWWEQVIRSYPNDTEAQLGRAFCLEALGDQDQAAIGYRRALDLDPKREDIYAHLVRLYAGRQTELLELLREMVLRDKKNEVLKARISELAARLGQAE